MFVACSLRSPLKPLKAEELNELRRVEQELCHIALSASIIVHIVVSTIVISIPY